MFFIYRKYADRPVLENREDGGKTLSSAAPDQSPFYL